MKKLAFIGSFLFCNFYYTVAQDNNEVILLTLDDCINTALEKNTQIKRANNDVLIAKANKFQSIMNFLPSLNANLNYDFFFGNFFDTNAARQVSEITNSSNPNIASDVTIFNGLNNHYVKKQRTLEYEASEYNKDDSYLTVESTILDNYLTVIIDRENIKVSEKRMELLEQQLERAKKRESVGVGGMEDVFNFQSQLSNEKVTYTNLLNTLRRDKLTLLQSMQLEIDNLNYDIVPVEAEDTELLQEIEPFNVVMEDILGKAPSLRAANLNMNAAQYQMKASSARRFPRLAVQGVVGSNYSSNGARNPETGDFEEDASLQQQLQYNEFQYVNVYLRIPIFNNYQRTTDYQVAKINMANAEIGVQEARNNITFLVQQVYLDYVQAQQTYISSKENLEALDQSFEFMKRRYETGNTDFYTYVQSLNNRDRASIQLINAKYSIIFRKKILDIYRNL